MCSVVGYKSPLWQLNLHPDFIGSFSVRSSFCWGRPRSFEFPFSHHPASASGGAPSKTTRPPSSFPHACVSVSLSPYLSHYQYRLGFGFYPPHSSTISCHSRLSPPPKDEEEALVDRKGGNKTIEAHTRDQRQKLLRPIHVPSSQQQG